MTRFDRFMEAALYHPERGYYTSRIKGVGTRGDFTTSAQLSSTLAKAIAASFRESAYTHLIEVGPGTGQLAAEIRRQLPFLTRRRYQHHLVEISPPLRELQKEANAKATHHDSLADAITAAKGRAFIYSNELVDAFPVRIFRQETDGFSELHLEKKEGKITERFLPATELPDSTLLSHSRPLRQRLEVHASYQQWLRENLVPLKEGQILTIDYALPPKPPIGGTLRGYLLQERVTGANLYQSAGHIDLTTDVSFQDLKHWGNSLELKQLWQLDQSDFLGPFQQDSAADRFLTDPQGAGSAFQVLLQERTA